ncbi:T9SS type A sorting domain-containing protein, partial [candidate division KSB1 bacterium]|nr:T9SS type A sorting domain-containing protein [candidate division KSB1 bacterium]
PTIGEGIYSRIEKLEATTQTSIDHVNSLKPDEYSLLQNYPNPFNPQTSIEFHLPEASFVRISIFNLQGTEVCCLAQQRFDSGVHKILWNARNQHEQLVATGMYFCRMEVRSADGRHNISMRKMILAK